MNDRTMDPTLIGAIVGGTLAVAGSIAVPFAVEMARQRSERRCVAAALAGEVSAILNIVEQRQYIPELRKFIEIAKADPRVDVVHTFHFSVRRNPFAVYDSQLPRLGVLEPRLVRLLTGFYAQASAVLEDIADMNEGRMTRATRDESIQRLQRLLVLLEETDRLGREILGLSLARE